MCLAVSYVHTLGQASDTKRFKQANQTLSRCHRTRLEEPSLVIVTFLSCLIPREQEEVLGGSPGRREGDQRLSSTTVIGLHPSQ